MLGAHADPPQQPPLLFAEDAVNLPHRWEVELIWGPIKTKIIIQAAAKQSNPKGRSKADLSGSNPGPLFNPPFPVYSKQIHKMIHLNMLSHFKANINLLFYVT